VFRFELFEAGSVRSNMVACSGESLNMMATSWRVGLVDNDLSSRLLNAACYRRKINQTG
jgi:hypothetical protein